MSESKKWEEIGRAWIEGFAEGIASAVETIGLGDVIRGALADKHGCCRVCRRPFDEPPQEDPGDICETCHVNEVLAASFAADSDRGGEP